MLLKGRGSLETALQPLGVTVAWSEFPSGPPLLEALNAGAIDFGSAGEAPPIFAQAASPELRYVATEPPAPAGGGDPRAQGQPVRSVADLRGKTIALNKGSNVHFLLVRALAQAGVPYDGVKLAFLAPADANAAFVRGSVDAWAIWDPYLAAAERATGARVLADGQGLAPNRHFYLSRRGFTDSSPEIVSAVLKAIGEVDAWAEGHADAVAAENSPPRWASPRRFSASPWDGCPTASRPSTPRRSPTSRKSPTRSTGWALLPRPIRVADAVWTQPERRAENRAETR